MKTRIFLQLMFSLLFAMTALGQIQVVSTGANTGPVTVNVTAGHVVAAECDVQATSGTITISDSQGDVFAQEGPTTLLPDFGVEGAVFLAKNVRGGSTTFTCHPPAGGSSPELYLTELAGVDPSSPLDGQPVMTSGLTGAAIASVTTSSPNDILWVACITGTCGNPSGWTALSSMNNNLVSFEPKAQPGTFNLSFPVSANWMLGVLPLKAAGSLAARSSIPTKSTLTTKLSVVYDDGSPVSIAGRIAIAQITSPTSSITLGVLPLSNGAASGSVTVDLTQADPLTFRFQLLDSLGDVLVTNTEAVNKSLFLPTYTGASVNVVIAKSAFTTKSFHFDFTP